MKKTVSYIVLACLISWALLGILFLTGEKWNTSILSTAIGVLYMGGPLIAVVIVQKLIYKESIKSLGINFKLNKWWLIAYLYPLSYPFYLWESAFYYPM